MRPTAGNPQVAAGSAAAAAVSVQETEAEPLIKVRDLTVEFRTQSLVRAVHGISYAMAAGEHVGLVGESGSGKSASALALVRLLPRTATVSGSVELAGRELMTLSESELREVRGGQVGIVYQDPFSSLSPRLPIENIIGEGLEVHFKDISKSEREDRIVQSMRDVALDPDTRHRYPHEFSGGQRQRVSIARAMVLAPEFVVLDEPTSALDLSVQAQIVDLLRGLQEKYSLSYMFISHDLRVVKAMAHDLIVMKDGQIVEQGAATAIFDSPQKSYTKRLLNAALNLKAV